MAIDLAPFGFTPTESLAYGALLALGPSSGYAVARELTIARANAYQALNGLTAKGAAARSAESPRVYRAVRPDALLARVVEREARKLDALEAQVAEGAGLEGETLVPLNGLRSFSEVATRWIVRLDAPVVCLAPGAVLIALVPAWRKRSADGRRTTLWSIGERPDLPVPITGTVPASDAGRSFGVPVALLQGGDAVMLATVEGPSVRGYWSSDRILVAVVESALGHLPPNPSGGAG